MWRSKAVFEKDAPSAEDLVDPMIRIIPASTAAILRRTAYGRRRISLSRGGACGRKDHCHPRPRLLHSGQHRVDNDGILRYDKGKQKASS